MFSRCALSAGIFLATIQAIYGLNLDYPAFVHVPAPNPIANCNPSCNPNPQSSIVPQYDAKSGSIFCKVPSVAIFTNTFIQTVFSTPILREVFDLSQTSAKQFADFARKYIEKALTELGVEEASALAEFAFRAIEPNFDILTLRLLANHFANATANFFFVEGILTIENAQELALAYAQAIADSAKLNMNSDPTSKFPSLLNGTWNFKLSRSSKTKTTVAIYLFYVGNEWFLAAVNYRWI